MKTFFLDVVNDTPGILFQNGKIFTVAVVLFIIFVGIAFYLFRTDRKISGLEKRMNNIQSNDKSNSK